MPCYAVLATHAWTGTNAHVITSGRSYHSSTQPLRPCMWPFLTWQSLMYCYQGHFADLVHLAGFIGLPSGWICHRTQHARYPMQVASLLTSTKLPGQPRKTTELLALQLLTFPSKIPLPEPCLLISMAARLCMTLALAPVLLISLVHGLQHDGGSLSP